MRPRRQPEIIAGRVNGADGAIAAGDGFTSVRVSAGLFTLTFPAGFRLIACTVTAIGAVVASTASVGGSSINVSMFVGSTGASSDTSFNFIAVGVQQ